MKRSLPSRGAWIEILTKYALDYVRSRSPHGERGLKLSCGKCANGGGRSLPSRGAWIEIRIVNPGGGAVEVAPLTGSVD